MSHGLNDTFNVTSDDHSVTKQREYPKRLLQLFASLREQCRIQMKQDPPSNLEGPSCGRTVDNWGGCWPDTLPNTMATIACPEIPSFNIKETAEMYCTENGTWSTDNDTGNMQANYSRCFTEADPFEGDTKYVYIYIGGFSLSLVLLIISLAIFLRFKQLRCDRITIHINLFLSYLLTGIAWILNYVLVMLNGDVLLENPVWCRILHVICYYFVTCNFMWMFCEGLYLNTIMVYAFTSGKKLLVCCYIIGWGFPFVVVAIYAGIRNSLYLETLDCWMGEISLMYIMAGPICASILLNLIFLINVMRLLMTKLRRMPEIVQTKKATRATLILVPLLGLQFLLLPWKPNEGTVLEKVYHIVVALAISLQGAFVSMMYCLLNAEVMSVITRKYNQHRLMRKRSSFRSSTNQNGAYSTVDNTQLQNGRAGIHKAQNTNNEIVSESIR
ncbi:calcitonin gene-related peptide type 1 receptor-like isoform X2 [Mya arenaria]|uniref:calcitonin gene-related peptide type 1 receptor-like isoform X2 n=1 Tax=Mya arenaria TaxID=6604 RepID=UPI0022E41612|nr:calcitonin gene-related peptide type 1 receptor-like isoform X2 [Mya arenaria]